MKKNIIRILSVLLVLCALTLAGCGDTPSGDVLALMYHDLTENEVHTSAWVTTPAKFRADLTALLDAGYLPLSLEAYTAGEFDEEQMYFIVTFDDGYTSNLTLALPILEELGIPATVFVVTGYMGTDGYMSWDDLRMLTASGLVSVYSHTDSHLNAGEVTAEMFLADEARAWSQIEDVLSPPMKALAFPYGAYTKETMEALAAEGYEIFAVQDVPPWYEENGVDHVRILKRCNVEYGSDILEIAAAHRAYDN